ncbi:MAG: hypothetical protein ABIJ47_12970 [Candidatus Bathyarchaeota archaeon]
MAIIVANEILFLSSQMSHVCFTLCKIIIIGLNLEFSQMLIFPNIVGIDPWVHRWFTLTILDNGNIPEGFLYTKLPMMHLMIGITSIVTGLGYKMAMMVSISVVQVVCDALFVFLLGKFLISAKIGLMAALLLEVATYHILFGYWIIPNTLAATLILPIIFVLFKVRRDKQFIGTLIALLLMGTLILTHALTAMCFAILLFLFWAAFESYNRLFIEETLRPVKIIVSILFSVGMLAYWTYASGHIMNLANFIKWDFDKMFLAEYAYLFISSISFEEKIFTYLGIFLYFAISFIGCFYVMSKGFRNSYRFTFMISSVVILIISFLSVITDRYIIQHCWYYLTQIMMSLPLSTSLLLLVGIIKNQLMKRAFISLSIFCLSFLLIMTPIVNIDNHLFSPNSGIRFAFTESELHATNIISNLWNGKISSDWYYQIPFEYEANTEFVNIDSSLYAGDFTDLQGVIILIREEIIKNPYYTSSGSVKLEYDLYLTLDHQNFSRIYDAGSISAYVK